MGSNDLHIFIDTKKPAVFVSLRGSMINAEAVLKDAKNREISLRHIVVSEDGSEIRIGKQDGVLA